MRNSPKTSKFSKGSFRDPSGFLFIKNGQLLRRVDINYKDNFDYFVKSGLYKKLTEEGYLISHKSVKFPSSYPNTYKIIKPEKIPFISYPYEWCFSQLKDAALLTLLINRKSIEKGMILKDASAYNVQFLQGKPIFIDTLSFEKYKEGTPWIAYQQFCRHLLSPLLLAAYKDYRLMQFSRIFIDGIPLDLTSKLLPLSSILNFSVLTNIHMHSKAESFLEDKFVKRKESYISQNSLFAIINNLENLISKLDLRTKKTEWLDYYEKDSYGNRSLRNKKNIVKGLFKEIGRVDMLWDLGSNIGYFSKALDVKNTFIVDFDNDILAVEKDYKEVKKRHLTNVLPLFLDLTNPSSGIGWANEERDSLIQRGPCDVALALALIHHFAITHNLPLSKIANFFKHICKWLIIEFVPKGDFQIKRLLLNREDIFSEYNQENFEKEFSNFFYIRKKIRIYNSERVMYLMKRK
ncbi:hypothetical protein A2865_02015 [Candidatus Woesebacteria bacterium RIFCSPHIGHO2_01_FULL_39_17]|nr:MAG: Nodulation protein NoeA-related protein [Microgenomates group bacterium GW2011_GWC1_38_12]OGM23087.1 MAG: hypothetical protein A2865_02015 [Candidatus Woesebacteria bacterium RIFCSPHIGHO2_01_FULL_39_17]OGM61538.1 MAG: hypothetical protein A3A52_04245 [Candidatus Woesebacteria bacterium RIFCSPLOWO2_01_FULL_39_14]